jgi:signal transduction histidine kinase
VSRAPDPKKSAAAGWFRTKLTAAIMLVLLAATGLAFYLAQRHIVTEARRDLQQDFESALQSVHDLQQLRNAALMDRCRAFVAKPRIHAALEDNAIDLLYPSAKEELRDLMTGEGPEGAEAAPNLHARFYRFLDSTGAVLSPPNPEDVGPLSPNAESALCVPNLPQSQQFGYVEAEPGEPGTVDELVLAPIHSSETGEVISALVVGFKPLEPPAATKSGLTSGIWVNKRLHMPTVSEAAVREIAFRMNKDVTGATAVAGNFMVDVDRSPHLLFYDCLNPHSIFTPAYEVCLYSLAPYETWQRRLRWQIGLTGLFLVVLGFFASRFIAGRLALPVAQLEMQSKQERNERERAEAALELTSEELERTAHYSANASHQLKSPVTVLRSGLESLLARDNFDPDVYEELSVLLHQTYRLTGVIDDLLLLARMDAGRLKLESEPVDLAALVDNWLDDLSAMPDSPEIRTEKYLPPNLHVLGEARYTSLIVQNLLENARKYNRPGGRIVVRGEKAGDAVVLTIGNTGLGIPMELQEQLFERFQRGTNDSNAPGHGLGLNLARELARLHGGNLRLVRSEGDWTEFELRLRAMVASVKPLAPVA